MDKQLGNRLRFLRKANTEGMPHTDRGLLDTCLALASCWPSGKRAPRTGRLLLVIRERRVAQKSQQYAFLGCLLLLLLLIAIFFAVHS